MSNIAISEINTTATKLNDNDLILASLYNNDTYTSAKIKASDLKSDIIDNVVTNIPTASSDDRGLVKVGDSLSVDESGTLNVSTDDSQLISLKNELISLINSKTTEIFNCMFSSTCTNTNITNSYTISTNSIVTATSGNFKLSDGATVSQYSTLLLKAGSVISPVDTSCTICISTLVSPTSADQLNYNKVLIVSGGPTYEFTYANLDGFDNTKRYNMKFDVKNSNTSSRVTCNIKCYQNTKLITRQISIAAGETKTITLDILENSYTNKINSIRLAGSSLNASIVDNKIYFCQY
jgi:hypothetical protein